MIEQLTPQRAGECIDQERSRNLRTPAAMRDPGRVNAPYPALVLRVTLGLMFITHLYWKFEILPGGLDRWWSGLAANGYPGFVTWYVISAEFAGALLSIPGIYTRWVRLYTLPMMLGAAQFWLVRKGFYFTAAGAELPVIWSIMLVLQAMLGDGPYAVEIGLAHNRQKQRAMFTSDRAK
jgi:putative oxidoreductase